MGAEEILASLSEAVILIDPEGTIKTWNGGARAIFGFRADEAQGSNIDELLSPRDANGNPCQIRPERRVRDEKIVKRLTEMEFLTSTKGGGERWVGTTLVFRRAPSGELEDAVVVARDITRRKQVDLAKSEVISAVSHELRSPLTSVKGFTSTLLNKWDRFDDETKKHLLMTINSDADRVTRLIGELLDISRLEAGRLMLKKQLVDVGSIAKGISDRMGTMTEGHQIDTSVQDGFPEVLADPDKVEQVITNLVENAIKYTDEGRIVIGCELEGDEVKVCVSDEGAGIPADQRTQVFGKFFRTGSTRPDNPTGTGLGLYIAKGLVEAHGGKIWVEDAPGGGALFCFTIPTEDR